LTVVIPFGYGFVVRPNDLWSTDVSVDAVDQFQVQTSSTSAAYHGQGLQNYTLKSGSNQFHGRAFEYFRNTVLDIWGWSSKYDDTGTGRTAYGNNAYIERSLSTTDQPSNVSAYAVWEEPFGHDNGNRFVSALIKDYAISGIYRYTSGYPLAITASGCKLPFSGTCMPNLNPDFHGPIRINYGYGHNTYKEALATPFIDYRAFSAPSAYTSATLLAPMLTLCAGPAATTRT
jgi:hypothetical protein